MTANRSKFFNIKILGSWWCLKIEWWNDTKRQELYNDCLMLDEGIPYELNKNTSNERKHKENTRRSSKIDN